MPENTSHRLNVALLFGGRSSEHEVSLQSAKNIHDALDKSKYDVDLIAIDKTGKWSRFTLALLQEHAEKRRAIVFPESGQLLSTVPGHSLPFQTQSGDQGAKGYDVVFPVLHGTFGEDGSIQGLMRLAGLAYVGPSLCSSAVGMDKDLTKRLWRDAGIPVADFRVFHRHQRREIDFRQLISDLGTPLFVKPANQGSSVGVNRASTELELESAVDTAFRFDSKILIEEAVPGREVECAVLGNESPSASRVGEIVASHSFYDYEAKYLDENGASLHAPADLPEKTENDIRELSLKCFTALGCEGMARVDFFLKADGMIVANEINTIPGFTRISMYPRLWEISGLPYPKLLDRLIELALQRHQRESGLQTSL